MANKKKNKKKNRILKSHPQENKSIMKKIEKGLKSGITIVSKKKKPVTKPLPPKTQILAEGQDPNFKDKIRKIPLIPKVDVEVKAETLNDVASKHLGSSNSYAVYTDKFDSSLLVPMPRALGRKDWNIENETFIGVDVWQGHESTFLLNNGLPVAGTLKIIYFANSEFMVESKSFKLYLNSFDMCKMGATFEEAVDNYERQIRSDLQDILKTDIKVSFLPHGSHWLAQDPTIEFEDLYVIIPQEELETLTITDFNSKEKHLKFSEDDRSNSYRVFTNVLRSRCRHTKQKDSGSVYVYVKTKLSTLDLTSLLKQIISFRETNEFHELCCDKLYSDLMKTGYIDECLVMMLYSRRGSLDISPVRASYLKLIPKVMLDSKIYTEKAMCQ